MCKTTCATLVSYAMYCMAMGGRWISWDPRTETIKYLYVQVVYRDTFEQEWAMTQAWMNQEESLSADDQPRLGDEAGEQGDTGGDGGNPRKLDKNKNKGNKGNGKGKGNKGDELPEPKPKQEKKKVPSLFLCNTWYGSPRYCYTRHRVYKFQNLSQLIFHAQS